MNFEDFSNKVKQISKDTVQEVQRLNEVRVLKGQANDAKKQINGLYSEIGKRLYEQYKEAPMDGYELEIRSITDKLAQIEELKERIRKVKGVVLCPCCNMEVAAGEKFCSNCGSQMPDTAPESDEDDEIIIDAEDGDVVDVTADDTEQEAEASERAAESTSDSEPADEAAADMAADAEPAAEHVSGNDAEPASEPEQEAEASESDAEPEAEELTEKEPEGE